MSPGARGGEKPVQRPVAASASSFLQWGDGSSQRLRSTALVALTLIVLLAAAKIARSLILPVAVSIILYLLFAPIVRGLCRLHIPSPLSAMIVLVLLVAAIGGGIYKLAGPTIEWLERAPSTFSAAERKLRKISAPVQKVNRAAAGVENLTEMTDSGKPSVRQVEIKEKGLADSLMMHIRQLTASTLTALALVYFLLATNGRFLHVLTFVALRDHSREAVETLLRSTERQISSYLATVTAINVLLGVAVGVAMHLLGLPNPTLWGVMATALNFVPYLGAIVGVAVVTMVSILTFDGLGQTALPPLAYLALTSIEGTFVTPTVLGRRLSLSPVAILLWLFLLTWLWGVGGALLAVPSLAIIRIACDHIPQLASLGLLLDRGTAVAPNRGTLKVEGAAT